MAKRKKQKNETDSKYFIKLLVFFFLGAFWLRIGLSSGNVLSLPVGMVVGLLLARRERFQVDRKIEYAVLLIGMVLGAYIPIANFGA